MSKSIKAFMLVLLVFSLSSCSLFRKETEEVVALPTPKPEPVNLIPVSQRPYVTLQPLVGRNELELVIHDLKSPADEVEVILEYDRNEGVMDAVYRTFFLDDLPLEEMLFMGSRSAGGHITYHDDVIGGQLELRFSGGDQDYALRVPWRYDDQNSPYTQLSTADASFQLELASAIQDRKVVVMQSPGLPVDIEEEVIAGPYLVRAVRELPDTLATVSIRVPQDVTSANLWGWDGEELIAIESTQDNRIITAESEVYSLYVVTQ